MPAGDCIVLMWDELQGEPRPTGNLGSAALLAPLQLSCVSRVLSGSALCDSILSSGFFCISKYEPRLKHIKYKQKTKYSNQYLDNENSICKNDANYYAAK
jgi:hypothetical protein